MEVVQLLLIKKQEKSNMESRIVKTNFWRDTKVQLLSKEATYLFMYFLTCPYINLCGLFELPDAYIELETKLKGKKLQKVKKELQANKRVYFYQGWVYIPNARIHNRYQVGPKTRIAYVRQVENLPKKIKDGFKALTDSSIELPDTTTILPENINKKTEIINNKTEYINKKEELVKKLSINEDVKPEDIPF